MKCLQASQNTALIFKDQSLNYTQLLEQIARYAVLIQANPCKKVAIYAENRCEWVYAFYAGWKSQCIVVPIDMMATPEEIAYMLNDCQPEVLFCSQAKRPEAQAALALLSYTPRVLVFEELADDLRAVTAPPVVDFPDSDPAATALIIYTSGTTGSPKGAMLSFENLLVNIEGVSRSVPIYTPEQRVLVLLPLHHIFPLLGTIVIPLYVGGTCVFSPSMASEDILATLQQHGVTMIVAVPRFYNLIRKGIREKIDRSVVARTLFHAAERANMPALSKAIFKAVHQRFGGKIQHMVCGGAAIDNEVARDFKTLGFDLLPGFGMTEAAPMISFTHPGTLRIGSSGQILAGVEVKIVEDEIVAKGRNLMQGYYHRPEETAAVIQHGWLYTGDLGYLDADGFLFVTGRKKDIIVLPNGKNINPEEIESKILKQFDTVREIGVFLDHNNLHAIIYPNFERMHAEGVHHIVEFIRWNVLDTYNQTTSPAKKIMDFTIVKQELPKTRLGKLRRFQLPSLKETVAVATQSTAEPEDPEYQAIKHYLAEQTTRPISPEAHLELDLGLDSLDKVSLFTFLSATFGVDMQDEEMLHHLTVGKIADYVRQKKVKMDVEGVNWQRILHEPIEMELPKSWFLHAPGNHFLKGLFNLYFRLTATGLDRLPKPPFILAVNHQSMLDAFLLSQFFNTAVLKQSYFYADAFHFQQRWRQFFARHHNVIIMDINHKLKLSLQKMAAVLKSGKNMVIFPEGARSRDGHLGEFKKTFAILSRELNIPIVPVAVQGAYEAMPVGARLPKFRHPIQVSFLPPIFPETLSYDELTQKVYQRIKQQLDDVTPAMPGRSES